MKEGKWARKRTREWGIVEGRDVLINLQVSKADRVWGVGGSVRDFRILRNSIGT